MVAYLKVAFPLPEGPARLVDDGGGISYNKTGVSREGNTRKR